jgi:hypothetical protein
MLGGVGFKWGLEILGSREGEGRGEGDRIEQVDMVLGKGSGRSREEEGEEVEGGRIEGELRDNDGAGIGLVLIIGEFVKGCEEGG